MLDAAARMLPFLIIGAWTPTWTVYIMVLLGTKRPVTNSMAYVWGNAFFRLLLGLAALTLVDMRTAMRDLESAPPPSPYFVGAVGALLLLGGLLLLFGRRSEAATDEEPKVLSVLTNLSPKMVFGYGMLGMAIPGLQYVYFLGGVGILSRADLPPEQVLLLLVAFVVLLQTMLLVPIGLYSVRRERMMPVFDRARRWLGLRGRSVLGVLLTVLGAYLTLAAVFS